RRGFLIDQCMPFIVSDLFFPEPNSITIAVILTTCLELWRDVYYPYYSTSSKSSSNSVYMILML
ncbi:MAG: hypothetical protein M1477_01890, partial [Candidatus Thermoplasmatota archaeon]|nr:hypothetical protein [Candidatus Thermoplasmatota archaeon]